MQSNIVQILWWAVCQGAGPGAGRGRQHEQPAVQLRGQAAAGEGEGRRDRAPHDQQGHLQVTHIIWHYYDILMTFYDIFVNYDMQI